ncbi:YoaK family protein [Aspergillus undulatus]|uniref:YoaK family protein n=1 Tax=Aspergillus undulatus TaxID=1810928 RepID=UPI003CCCE973
MQAPPGSSNEIEKVPTAPNSSNNRLTYWDTANGPSGQQCDSKDPRGIWSVGGSTTVSLAENLTTLYDDGPVSWQSSLARHMKTNIDPRYTDIFLVLCGFVGGLVDGLSFNAWGSFSSMQTGNTVFIALGVSGQPAYPAYLWAKSLIAVTVFILGNVLFIQVGRALGARRRSTLILSFGVQTAAIFVAAMLVQLGVVDPKPEDPRAPIQWMQVLPISLLAFQAAGQIVASRVLEFDELPTVVLTTLLCDLLVDPNLGAALKDNPKRNRRVGGFLALFLGAMTAGGLSKVTEMAASLWFAMGIKLVITVSWFVWKGERSRKVEGIGSV